MNRAILQDIFYEELADIAPEVERIAIDNNADIRDELDINALDFKLLIRALGNRIGIQVPESEHDHLRTINNLMHYLLQHLPENQPSGTDRSDKLLH